MPAVCIQGNIFLVPYPFVILTVSDIDACCIFMSSPLDINVSDDTLILFLLDASKLGKLLKNGDNHPPNEYALKTTRIFSAVIVNTRLHSAEQSW
jgi:hypothetical protein